MKLLVKAAKQAQRTYFQRILLYRFTSDNSPLRKGLQSTECQWLCASSQEILTAVRGLVEFRQNFISEAEEKALFKELEPGLRKKRYEFDHWDDAIHGFRETERLQWGDDCESVFRRVREVAFPKGSSLLGPVHVLDLDKAGYIKPHVDSVKFCGSTIAGLSLLSDSIMRLIPENNSAEWLNLLLSRRSLYILRDDARFKYTHAILKDEESFFAGQKVPRHRRISVICRNLPV
ncbi:alpha-ketoglutarate-dependent dioxygenase alkB homolog 7, mitochondrial isoform X2 [Triplophysa rosa]|uniref:Alpha-ketoglutarate-dependent dioxygenase alkB-like protein 7 n=1 Tax=Triplophysa rosa TaxID=992332 RepID=A0A9W7TWG5_TRIRA|nr:alpha-ketoglutarate-dependent dioxygenase alkB homolog 7, mitochondrial isoform X2 [Triplophysa rosa]KAI7803499.1 alpha-ketoglutarate-dependent dioxygenase alkB-like protein 7 [Triplophysa rosa]